MSALLKDDRQWDIVDPLHHNAFETSRGVLQPNAAGYIRTRDSELVKEIEEREPWVLATEHGGLHGDGKRTRTMIVVPEMPWKKERDGQKAEEDQKEH